MKAFPHHKKNSAIPYAGACYKIFIYSRPKQAFVYFESGGGGSEDDIKALCLMILGLWATISYKEIPSEVDLTVTCFFIAQYLYIVNITYPSLTKM